MSEAKPIRHTDTIAAIEAIERNDLWPLLHEGDARIIHNSRHPNFAPLFKGGSPSLTVRVYQVIIRRKDTWPLTIDTTIRFIYDSRINRGRISINAVDARFLWINVFGNGHNAAAGEVLAEGT